MEGDLGLNLQTLIVPLNSYNSWYLFYYVIIFLIIILGVLFCHPHISFPFFFIYVFIFGLCDKLGLFLSLSVNHPSLTQRVSVSDWEMNPFWD